VEKELGVTAEEAGLEEYPPLLLGRYGFCVDDATDVLDLTVS
jgi:hypothetical protein